MINGKNVTPQRTHNSADTPQPRQRKLVQCFGNERLSALHHYKLFLAAYITSDTPTFLHIFDILSNLYNMVRTISRKSSTISRFAKEDPLPAMPNDYSSLTQGFTIPESTRELWMPQDDLDKAYPLLEQKLANLAMRTSDMPTSPQFQSQSQNMQNATDYMRQFELASKRSQQMLRNEQAKLDALLQDCKSRTMNMNLNFNNNNMTTHRSMQTKGPEAYTKPFCDFLTKNPTVFHAAAAFASQLSDKGFKELSERDNWDLQAGGKYFVQRNGSSLIAFSVGRDYKAGNGVALIGGHIDALTARLKPVSKLPTKAGYVQLGVAPYAGALSPVWWDRDLSVGGRVQVREGSKIVTKLVALSWPIAHIPTLAPHYGAPSIGPFNPETQAVPVIGLESAKDSDMSSFKSGTFASTAPPRLFRAIAKELGIAEDKYDSIINWELELFDIQPATVGGIDKEFIFAGRLDDKLCSWAALQALLNSSENEDNSPSLIKMCGLFDDEEIGSMLRQGARGNFLPLTVERAVSAFADKEPSAGLIGRAFANSFFVSADVTHAINPNFAEVALKDHAAQLNVGAAMCFNASGSMSTDAMSATIFKECADRANVKLQISQERNDSRGGSTIGPMLSSATGIRALDCGIPQLAMHSIRATTGALDPGLGVQAYQAFYDHFEEVDKQFV